MTSLWKRIFTERRSVLVPLIGLVLIDVALVAGVVMPLKKVVASDTAAAEQAKFNTAVATGRLRQMQNTRASRDRAEQELSRFYGQVLPTSQAAAGNLLQLEVARLARENNLSLLNRNWENAVVKDTSLSRFTTKVELLGDYASILRFIYDVETSQAFLAIRSVQLSQATRQQAANGQLQLALEITTYYRGDAAK
mgnify:CR=1 FL=1